MNSAIRLHGLLAAALMLSGCGVGEERPARPNILFIMADDHTTQASLIKELKQELLDLKWQFGDTDDKYPELAELNITHF